MVVRLVSATVLFVRNENPPSHLNPWPLKKAQLASAGSSGNALPRIPCDEVVLCEQIIIRFTVPKAEDRNHDFLAEQVSRPQMGHGIHGPYRQQTQYPPNLAHTLPRILPHSDSRLAPTCLDHGNESQIYDTRPFHLR